MAQPAGAVVRMYTEVFDMQTRPELIMLQKTMVVVEGQRAGRSTRELEHVGGVPEPIVKEWLESQLGAGARIEQAAEGAASVGRFVGDLPKLLRQAEHAADSFAVMAEDGLRLDEESVVRLAQAQKAQDRWTRLGIWVGALALLAIAVAQIL
jgi:ubiquinone biosynthesis protein